MDRLLPCLVVATFLSISPVHAGDEPDSVRGIPWGASPEQAKTIAAAKGEKLGCYDDVCIAYGDIGPVWTEIIYGFTDDKLTRVFLRWFKIDDYSALKNVFIERYGPPIRESPGRFESKSELNPTTETLRWEGEKILVEMMENDWGPGNGQAFLWLRAERDRKKQELLKKHSERKNDASSFPKRRPRFPIIHPITGELLGVIDEESANIDHD